ncbi:NAD(P)-dependent oxidoreductase [Deinococcus aquiradiocola]|uniref:2-hydroxy-3-oxopropionate reductase n=1 Tax=Deinococcus aquiradiocola TaxID=393059 RepID=A0A917P9H5_9DEIO|nr:NAD(P)-dependent oxidoreductase [Deinococcus aquiradiocola]GGJ67716.1 2-hydroxy-3-oxopropionate reductase [Deinococcus aquiradiocola]
MNDDTTPLTPAPLQATPARPAVALIGTGLMGRPMAENLLRAGFPLTVYDRSPEPLALLARQGAQVAGTAAGAARHADVVITMLPNGDIVNRVLLDDLLLDALRPGTLLIDMSSIHPGIARDHAALLLSRGLAYLDAPVSGGTVGAAQGTLAIMVGGPERDAQRADAVFRALGSPTHVGPHGSGQLCKLVNQAIVAVTIGAVAEGLTLARAGGADPARVREAIMGGFCQSRILDLHGARMVEREFEPGGSITNQVKDLDAVLDVASRHGVQMPLTHTVRDLFADMVERGEGGRDHSALVTQIERLAGLDAVKGPA